MKNLNEERGHRENSCRKAKSAIKKEVLIGNEMKAQNRWNQNVMKQEKELRKELEEPTHLTSQTEAELKDSYVFLLEHDTEVQHGEHLHLKLTCHCCVRASCLPGRLSLAKTLFRDSYISYLGTKSKETACVLIYKLMKAMH